MAGRPALSDKEYERTLAALEEHKWNQSEAARALGIPRKTLNNRVLVARAQGKLADGSPLDGYNVKGTSTLYGPDGDVRGTWVKTEVDRERQEQILRETIAAMVEDIKPAKKTTPPKTSDADIAVAYLIGDAHLGLYSWAPETGDDFDINIATRDLRAAADRLIASTPASDEAIVVQLGDFFHADDSRSITPMSGNRLDTDGRFPKVIRAGITTMRYIISGALAKHQRVVVRNVAGNHDPHAYLALVEALRVLYELEPRVVIEDSPRDLFAYRFGSNLVGITHGHNAKPEQLPGVLAVDARQHWGECEHRFVWTGHVHTKRQWETMGTIVESFRTLAAKDKWHADMGYRAGREMTAIVLHKDFGEIERHTAGLRMIRGT